MFANTSSDTGLFCPGISVEISSSILHFTSRGISFIFPWKIIMKFCRQVEQLNYTELANTFYFRN